MASARVPVKGLRGRSGSRHDRLGAPSVGRKTGGGRTEADNLASQRVLEKAGFVPSGEYGEEGPRFVLTSGA